MTQEEKAKAYDEALKVINDNLNALNEIAETGAKIVNIQTIKNCFYRAFPELKESEDERIRKALINVFSTHKDYEMFFGASVEDIRAWLEKQGEQKVNYTTLVETGNGEINALVTGEVSNSCDYEEKPANEIEPKFHRDEWVVFNNHHASVYRIEKIENHEYTLRHFLGGSMPLSFSHEDIIRPWTIEDAEDGDVLCDYHETWDNPLIFILKKFEHVNFGLVRPSDYSSYCFLTAGDIQRFKEGTYHHKHNIKPATKEQRDLLFEKMKEAGYEWSDKNRKLSHSKVTKISDKVQKSTWSEEDEVKINRIVACLENLNVADNDILLKDVDWLKSLKPQLQWKPSNEQIASITCAVRKMKESACYDSELVSLFNDLKKLREE